MASSSIHVVIDVPALTAFKSWDGSLGMSVNRLARETVWRQQQLAPKRTLAMSKSLTYRRGGNPGGKGIWFEAGSWTISYTLIMETGSKPHPIVAKNAPHLVFFWPKKGRVVHYKSVNHPGTKPYRFLTGGLEASMRMWERGG